MDMRCGTTAGYKAHLRRKESACQPCKNAESARTKARYAANPIGQKTANKRWAELNKEKRKASNLTWYHANKERKQALNKAWKVANPEAVRDMGRRNSSKRRALISGNGHEKYLETEVLSTYGTDCHICQIPIDFNAPRLQGTEGWELGLHIDHLIPISKGGTDTLENVRPAHGKCNLEKHAIQNG
jgi:hypothetical protein